jgi:hypothetical protein
MAFDLSDYATVEERIALFWIKYPDGRIDTDLVFNDGKSFIIKATAYRNDGTIIASDYACEVISDRGVNANFALENCATSGIGRVLSTAGLSAKIGKRPSREEMAKVQRVAANEPVPNDDFWNAPADIDAAITNAMEVIKLLDVPDDREPNNRAYPCKHGTRLYNSGKNASTGKKWEGYFCDSPQHKGDQCNPVGMDGKEWAKRK